MTIKIDRGIKMPPAGVGNNGGPPSKYPWLTMAVGDSFVYPGISLSARTQAARAGRVYRRKFSVRKIGDVVRVWHVK